MFWDRERKATPKAAVSEAILHLTALARYEGPERPVYTRLAHHGQSIFLDLADRQWRLVEIGADGWRVRQTVGADPFRFVRPSSALALPGPDARGSDLAALRGLWRMGDDDWLLLQAWLLGTLHPTGPYPVAVITGPQGSGKTTLCRVLKVLVDPSLAPLRTAPRTEDDLLISATHAHILAFDNLSHLSPELSDAMCRVSTGGGLAKRTHYTDAHETVLGARRPMVINGITDMVNRPDLLDRAVLIRLQPPRRRRTEEDILREVERLRPALLGALLRAVAHALATPAPPGVALFRMADFGLWAMRGLPSLGVSQDDFASAYRENRRGATALTLDESPLPAPLGRLLEERMGEAWGGTATALLAELCRVAGLSGPTPRTPVPAGWPKAANTLTAQLRRLQAPLLNSGIAVEFATLHVERTITVARVAAPGDDDDPAGGAESWDPDGAWICEFESGDWCGVGAGGEYELVYRHDYDESGDLQRRGYVADNGVPSGCGGVGGYRHCEPASRVYDALTTGDTATGGDGELAGLQSRRRNGVRHRRMERDKGVPDDGAHGFLHEVQGRDGGSGRGSV